MSRRIFGQAQGTVHGRPVPSGALQIASKAGRAARKQRSAGEMQLGSHWTRQSHAEGESRPRLGWLASWRNLVVRVRAGGCRYGGRGGGQRSRQRPAVFQAPENTESDSPLPHGSCLSAAQFAAPRPGLCLQALPDPHPALRSHSPLHRPPCRPRGLQPAGRRWVQGEQLALLDVPRRLCSLPNALFPARSGPATWHAHIATHSEVC